LMAAQKVLKSLSRWERVGARASSYGVRHKVKYAKQILCLPSGLAIVF